MITKATITAPADTPGNSRKLCQSLNFGPLAAWATPGSVFTCRRHRARMRLGVCHSGHWGAELQMHAGGSASWPRADLHQITELVHNPQTTAATEVAWIWAHLSCQRIGDLACVMDLADDLAAGGPQRQLSRVVSVRQGVSGQFANRDDQISPTPRSPNGCSCRARRSSITWRASCPSSASTDAPRPPRSWRGASPENQPEIGEFTDAPAPAGMPS
jgi:hypothetical protein